MYSAVKAGGGHFIKRVNNNYCYQSCIDAVTNPYRAVTEWTYHARHKKQMK